MKILAIDPGAERCGYALIESGPSLIESGVLNVPRRDQAFQEYRLRLEEDVAIYFDPLFILPPDKVTNEIMPAVGGGNFAVATQSYLANCTVSVLHTLAFLYEVPVEQISARTVQKQIGIKGRTGKVSKAGMRKGVLQCLPCLNEHIKDPEWPWDRWDAIGIGLAALGHITEG